MLIDDSHRVASITAFKSSIISEDLQLRMKSLSTTFYQQEDPMVAAGQSETLSTYASKINLLFLFIARCNAHPALAQEVSQ